MNWCSTKQQREINKNLLISMKNNRVPRNREATLPGQRHIRAYMTCGKPFLPATCKRPSNVRWMVTHLLGWAPLVVMAVIKLSSSSLFSCVKQIQFWYQLGNTDHNHYLQLLDQAFDGSFRETFRFTSLPVTHQAVHNAQTGVSTCRAVGGHSHRLDLHQRFWIATS